MLLQSTFPQLLASRFVCPFFYRTYRNRTVCLHRVRISHTFAMCHKQLIMSACQSIATLSLYFRSPWIQQEIRKSAIFTKNIHFNDVNNQQEATTFSFINLFKSALQVSGDKFAHPQEQFWLYIELLVQCTDTAADRCHCWDGTDFHLNRGCIVPQAVTHSIVFLKMGEIIARNMSSWLELLINRYCCI